MFGVERRLRRLLLCEEGRSMALMLNILYVVISTA